MFVIFEGRYFDWEPMGYVETEKEAKDICEEHNEHIWHNSRFEWYYLEVKPMGKENE